MATSQRVLGAATSTVPSREVRRKRIVAGLYLRTPLDHLRTIVRLDVFPLLGTDGKYVVVRHFGYPWTMGGVGAEQIAKMVLAVRGAALREGGTNQIAE